MFGCFQGDVYHFLREHGGSMREGQAVVRVLEPIMRALQYIHSQVRGEAVQGSLACETLLVRYARCCPGGHQCRAYRCQAFTITDLSPRA